MEESPFISAMIVVRNEEKYIDKSLKSLLNQTYPQDRYEILVIDGESDDLTLSKAKETELQHNYDSDKTKPRVPVRFLKNPKKLLAAGWNLGIIESKGDYVVRIDAHSYADKDFILKSVQTLQTMDDVTCVGGSMDTVAFTQMGKMIAKVLSSPFGVGNSKFRYSQTPQYVDTVAFGLYKKCIFNEVGLFDEKLRRNQDNDMHMRIRENGGKFYLNPEIKIAYYPRENISNMMKQAYNNGKWNIITFKKNPKTLSLRHLVPLFFVTGILCSLILGFFNTIFWQLLLGALTLYISLACVFAIISAEKIKEIIVLPILFLLLHLSYGIGSLVSILKGKGD